MRDDEGCCFFLAVILLVIAAGGISRNINDAAKKQVEDGLAQARNLDSLGEQRVSLMVSRIRLANVILPASITLRPLDDNTVIIEGKANEVANLLRTIYPVNVEQNGG
jgi:hypothetical protein